MINEVKGNIFDGDEDIICHQTNCLGIMGGGIALQVRKLFPNVYDEYVELCNQYKKNPAHLLGYTQFVSTNDGRIIANCFGQNNVGIGIQTDYNSLKLSLIQVRQKAERENLSVAIPYNIGCGLAGGDWNVVSKIIDDIFKDSNVNCVIYNFQG